MHTHWTAKRYAGLWLAALVALLTLAWSPVGRAAPVVGLPRGCGASLFLENVGQYDPSARFSLWQGNVMVWLAEDALWISMLDGKALAAALAEKGRGELASQAAIPGVHIKLSFVGANPAPALEPYDRWDAAISYMVGGDPSSWQVRVPAWGGVRYRDLYLGIDLVLEGARNPPWRLEARAGADLSAVRLRVEGAEAVAVKGARLHLATAIGTLSLSLPVLSESTPLTLADSSARKTGSGVFVVSAPFAIADPSESAQSTPAAGSTDLAYSTFLGGSSSESGQGIAVDDSGVMYVTGSTYSTDFPAVPGSYDTALGVVDAYVAKIAPNGEGTDDLAYATNLGGGGVDHGRAIAVSNGGAYLTGSTTSASFPTTEGAFDRSCGGDGLCDDDWSDAFLARLNADGTDLLYSTYLGGSDVDGGRGIAIEGGVAYLTGLTMSSGFPTTQGAYDRSCGSDGDCDLDGAPYADAFLVKLTTSGGGKDDLVYGTFLGGSDEDSGEGLAVYGGDAYVAGATASPDFPGTGYAGLDDAFVARIDPGGNGASDLVYSTVLGGSGWDWGREIALDGGAAWVTGSTGSTDFPATAGSYGGNYDAYVARLDGSGGVTYAAYLGGSGEDSGRGVAVDVSGGAVLVGYTQSGNFPVTSGAYDEVLNGGRDVYVARVDPGSGGPEHIAYATYLGGSGDDWGYGMAMDAAGYAYVGGTTQSSDSPTTSGAADESCGSDGDCDADDDSFAAKLKVMAAPVVDIEKHTNGEDADQPTGPILLFDSPVTWQYVVTNRGDFTLNGVQVSDNKGVTVSCLDSTLTTGEVMTCAASGLVQAGQYANLGTVAGQPVGDFGPVTDSDPSHYFGAVPGIDLLKMTNGEDADAAPGPYVVPGETVTWTYVVRNTGNVSLSGIQVTDDLEGSVSCPGVALDAGEAMTCTVTGEVGVGQYANVGTVTGTSPVGLDVTDNDLGHCFGSEPGLTIRTLTNGQDANEAPGPYVVVGDVVYWSYVVTNTGNVYLADISVEDDQGVEVHCPQTLLNPGESTVCTGSGVSEAGQYANTATASGTPPVGDDVLAADVSYYYGADPQIELQKLTNDEDGDDPPGPYLLEGEVLTWTYRVTNTGNVTLTGVTAVDDLLGAVSCPETTLAPTATMTCTVTGTATVGLYINVGTATGTPPGGLESVSDSDRSHYTGISASPAVDIQKRTNGHDADVAPGPYIQVSTVVTWEYLISNVGNEVLTGLVVTDSDPGVVISCTQDTLEVFELTVCTVTGTAGLGQYSNQAWVTGTASVSSEVVSDTDLSHYYGADPSIDVEKHTNGQDADAEPGPYILVGDAVTWTYTVTNTGNVSLSGVTVRDDQGLIVTCPGSSLAPAASMTCAASDTAAKGPYANRGTATGKPPGGLAQVSDWDDSHYYGADPSIEVEKHTNGQDADEEPGPYILVGGPVTWTYAVTNTGNVTLTGIHVSDDGGVGVTCPEINLAPGLSTTCTAAGTAKEGPHANRGTATGTPPGGLDDVSDWDDSHYYGAAPAIDLEKHTNGQDADTAPGPYILVGNPVTWTYAVTNTGNVTLTGIAVTDDQLGSIGCPVAVLPPGESVVCTAGGTAGLGGYANRGTVTGAPPDGLGAVSDWDDSHYFGADPGIDLETGTNGHDADLAPGPTIAVGDPVLWTYAVTNTGNVTLPWIFVTDSHQNQGVEVGCPGHALAPGAAMTCKANGIAVEGQYENRGTATGTALGRAFDDWDDSHYLGVKLDYRIYLPFVLRAR
ncbi:MAG: SBBP repeat-containing protein [Anaerolineae bacterium]|nr:SBBP repeat-containing protein [Anaerolineae bacterium]